MSPAGAPLRAALALALAAAVSLGLSRFSYALLLPPMRSDLAWSYTTAGAMNTVNAAGYLAGALLAPRWLARHDARHVMLIGGAAAALLLAVHAGLRSEGALYLVRAATGVASAASFIAGGLLAARLAGAAHGLQAGTVLGLYYGGTGLGIVASALLVPPWVAVSAAGWPAAWLALALLAAICTAVTAALTRDLHAPPAARAERVRFAWSSLAFGLAGYLCFGLGYIGYMTFIVTLLRDQGLGGMAISAFYALLGAAVIGSSWLWAGLLQRWRGGGVLALANALLAVATLLPVLSRSTPAAFVSGLLFGAVFLQVVAATTALVRHNLPAAAWPAGITAFTIVFAAGQIVGPTLVGYVADNAGGLLRGLAISAAVLALGAGLASLQRPLDRAAAQR
jgi:predicted MFS family arabinose efflux permease